MIRNPPQIVRPKLLGALATLSGAAGFAACMSVFNLAAAVGAPAVEIRAGADRLEATLASAPIVCTGEKESVVWLVTAPDCPECISFTVDAVADLQAAGFEVRMLTLRPGGNGPRHVALRSVAAENGADMELPAVFWRRGEEWRAAFGDDADPEQLAPELEPEA